MKRHPVLLVRTLPAVVVSCLPALCATMAGRNPSSTGYASPRVRAVAMKQDLAQVGQECQRQANDRCIDVGHTKAADFALVPLSIMLGVSWPAPYSKGPWLSERARLDLRAPSGAVQIITRLRANSPLEDPLQQTTAQTPYEQSYCEMIVDLIALVPSAGLAVSCCPTCSAHQHVLGVPHTLSMAYHPTRAAAQTAASAQLTASSSHAHGQGNSVRRAAISPHGDARLPMTSLQCG